MAQTCESLTCDPIQYKQVIQQLTTSGDNSSSIYGKQFNDIVDKFGKIGNLSTSEILAELFDNITETEDISRNTTGGNIVDSGSFTDLTIPNTIAHGNESFCSELRQYFDEIRNVTTIDDLTEEQFHAIGSLKVFLVEKLDCVDKFEDFEWD